MFSYTLQEFDRSEGFLISLARYFSLSPYVNYTRVYKFNFSFTPGLAYIFVYLRTLIVRIYLTGLFDSVNPSKISQCYVRDNM